MMKWLAENSDLVVVIAIAALYPIIGICFTVQAWLRQRKLKPTYMPEEKVTADEVIALLKKAFDAADLLTDPNDQAIVLNYIESREETMTYLG